MAISRECEIQFILENYVERNTPPTSKVVTVRSMLKIKQQYLWIKSEGNKRKIETQIRKRVCEYVKDLRRQHTAYFQNKNTQKNKETCVHQSRDCKWGESFQSDVYNVTCNNDSISCWNQDSRSDSLSRVSSCNFICSKYLRGGVCETTAKRQQKQQKQKKKKNNQKLKIN